MLKQHRCKPWFSEYFFTDKNKSLDRPLINHDNTQQTGRHPTCHIGELTMSFEALIAARDTISEKAYKLCKDWNIEPYLVRDHLTEVIRANHYKRQLVRIDN